jgi:diguanylate cyclase (GGDEF)-like protein
MALGALGAVAILELTIGRRRAGALADLLDRLWSTDAPVAAPSPPTDILLDARLRHAYGRLSARLAAAESLVAADLLTGLPGRHATLELLAGEVERAARDDRPLTVAVLEVEGLRDINERLGQDSGDAVLSEVARLLRASIRSVDLCGRISGSQFLVALPDTPPDVGRGVAEKLCRIIAAAEMPLDSAGARHVSLAAGIGGGEGRALDFELLLVAADADLRSDVDRRRGQPSRSGQPLSAHQLSDERALRFRPADPRERLRPARSATPRVAETVLNAGRER